MSGVSPIRVAFCHYSSDARGGSDYSLCELVAGLDRAAFTPLMLLRRGDPMLAEYRAADVSAYEFDLTPPRRSQSMLDHVRFARRLPKSVGQVAALLRAESVDVTHVNTMLNIQGALAAVYSQIPLVWHVRELLPESRLVHMCRSLVQAIATRVICNSKAVAASLPGCGSRLRVVYNGLDPQRVIVGADSKDVRQELDTPAAISVVTVLGRLEPLKGQHVVLDALALLRARGHDTCVWLVGDEATNKAGYKSQLQSRIADQNLSGYVRFASSRRDVGAVITASDVIVVPSITPESFSRVLLEALACRRPVIATAQGGPLEIIEHGRTGLLVPPDCPLAIADALHFLFSQPGQRAEMARRGERHVRTHFRLRDTIDGVSSVLREAAAGGRA